MSKPSDASEAPHGTYHFLDVGTAPYGDCILVEFGDLRILIDGGHVGDFDGGPAQLPIPVQLQSILGGAPPFDIALIVVTHCHADHIGCLPELVKNDIIAPRYALITDPLLGFGRIDGSDARADPPDTQTQAVIAAAMREEDVSFLSDDAIEGFLDAALKVEGRYGAFVGDLTARGTKVIRYQGQPLPRALRTLVKPSGLTILGPTKAQLGACARQIARTNRDATDLAAELTANSPDASRADLYRRVAASIDNADAFANPRGAGMNCQSITLGFGASGERVLLAGDMQFTAPNVAGIDAAMDALKQTVSTHGPYTLFKTTHHTSDNGQDDAFLSLLGNPPLIVHSGGAHDPRHPNAAVLTALRDRASDIQFARTDRNKIVSVQPHLARLDFSSGSINDFSVNRARDALAPPRPEPGAARSAGPQVIIINLPPGDVSMTVAGVTIDVDAADVSEPTVHIKQQGKSAVPAVDLLAAGRTLPQLLFVTDRKALARNIGLTEAAQAFAIIEAAGQALISVDYATALRDVGSALRSQPETKGIVIVGGYDVVPSFTTDTISADLRKALGNFGRQEPDEFIVWSDEIYGDTNGDSFAELPVSRIPDARDAALVFAALQAPAAVANDRFGIRNVARPFADQIWNRLAGTRALNQSEMFRSSEVDAQQVRAGLTYLMLHGREDDARKFEGEFMARGGQYPIALEAHNIRGPLAGLVFAGCCWGALSVSETAREIAANTVPSPRVAERSIALSYLKAGASAFVGCTGAHYSGPGITYEDNPALMLHEAFWLAAKDLSYAAAPALFAARALYFDFINSRADTADPRNIAQMLKNRTQFTCLGLGY